MDSFIFSFIDEIKEANFVSPNTRGKAKIHTQMGGLFHTKGALTYSSKLSQGIGTKEDVKIFIIYSLTQGNVIILENLINRVHIIPSHRGEDIAITNK